MATQTKPDRTPIPGQGNDSYTELQQLRFSEQEAAELLREAVGTDLPGAAVTALAARTEGWVAGLQLAGLSLRGHADPARFVASFSGSHRYVLDYLAQEVLERQSEQVRGFLLEISVLDRLTGSLCDAVTGHSRSQAMLEEIERANLFLLPLDEVRSWWRYHHLFAGLLRARLQAERPGRVAALGERPRPRPGRRAALQPGTGVPGAGPVLLAQDEPAQALGLLDRIRAVAAAQGRAGGIIEIQALRALAAAGDENAAVGTLAGALTLACSQGYIRAFADESVPMSARLARLVAAQKAQQAAASGVPLGGLARLLRAFGGEDSGRSSAAVVPGLVDQLTGRELEVLALLAAGAPNPHIAKELVVTLDTVPAIIRCGTAGVGGPTLAP